MTPKQREELKELSRSIKRFERTIDQTPMVILMRQAIKTARKKMFKIKNGCKHENAKIKLQGYMGDNWVEVRCDECETFKTYDEYADREEYVKWCTKKENK